ncbi:RagB/SusD family nutrient uptake outer membrane protein [Mangrovibacterium diazotrophicum]|uniref:Putative outer membrane starch-binding protein n=1 Tax=Mangrovibacterium diazotrophicum TaxID=1261403 RepID=A0A419W3C7_9BACT|nr:RagB/SusD family nutrient uptake outer membrane protein [Mangrovibacterium diazotrophicum]RKD89977.1 putative outer membrane starch-binding protein [Mangrovibacterium diazotrophicum]
MIKNKILPALLILLTLGFASCSDDFLDQTSDSEYTSDVVFSTPAYTNSAIMGIYNIMTYDEMYSSRLSLMYSTNSDIEVVGADQNSYNQQGNRGISNYYATPSWSGHLDRTWKALYKGIERANLAITEIPNSPAFSNSDTQSDMQNYYGEALTLRALYYFELVRNWGDVPFKLDPTQSDGENFYPAVADRDTILDHMIDDLTTAANLMDWGSTPERVSKGFALGLQARIALWRGGYSIRNKSGFPTERSADYLDYYQIARDACYKVMTEGPHSLTSSYSKIWQDLCSLTLNTSSYENMFEVAMGLTRSSEIGYSIGVRFRTNTKYGYGNNANVYSTTPYYFYQFDSEDVRRDISVACYEYRPNTTAANAPMEMFVSNPFSWTIGKYDQRWMSDEFMNINISATSKIGSGINWVIMRYSDVLLMFAEAENELNGGPTQEAMDALKQVRSRAFSETDQATKVDAYIAAHNDHDSFFEAVANERMFEFGGEGVRKYDLIRWNMLSSKIEEQRDALKQMYSTGEFVNQSGVTVDVPPAIYIKYNDDEETINFSEVNFYENKGTDLIDGYEEPVKWLWGLDDESTSKQNQLLIIDRYSSGLDAEVPNRHFFPIYQEIVNQSNGTISNSYGFN